MYVYIYIYMYMNVHICIHVCIHIYKHQVQAGEPQEDDRREIREAWDAYQKAQHDIEILAQRLQLERYEPRLH